MSGQLMPTVALALVGACLVTSAGCGGKRIHGDNDGTDDAGLPIDAPRPTDARVTTIPPDCLAAADRGVAWLVTQQNGDGSWGINLPVATTGFAVLKLETYAREIGQSPFDPGFVYANQVAQGLAYLFRAAQPLTIFDQIYGDPDGNGNGEGLQFSFMMYETAITLMAITAGGEPERVVASPGSAVDGRTYRAVAQDVVDYLAYAQADGPTSSPEACYRGGWRYDAFNNEGSVGDNSVSQFVTLALEYARNAQYGYELPIPAFVSAELRHWTRCVQVVAGPDDGASGYTSPYDIPNAYKTGALVQQLSFLGDTASAAPAVAALGYLGRNWNDTNGLGWRSSGATPFSDYLAMYAIMKGMESMAITDLGGIDWYRDFCDQLKLEQRADGSWPSSAFELEPVGLSGLDSTLWALLVLERAAPPPEIIP